jgi:hypothetical protein
VAVTMTHFAPALDEVVELELDVVEFELAEL